MATRIKIKRFSVLKRAVGYVKKNPTLPLAGATLTVSTANYATNRSRHNKDREYQDKQLKAMEDLTKALGDVKKGLNTTPPQKDKKENFLTKFKKKVL